MFIEFRPGQFLATDGLRLTTSYPNTDGGSVRAFFYADGSTEKVIYQKGEEDPTLHALSGALLDGATIEAAAMASAHATLAAVRERVDALPRGLGGMVKWGAIHDALRQLEQELEP